LNSSHRAGGPAVVMRGGHGAAVPQISRCLALGYTSFDGNIGGSKFKDQLINKKTRKLKRLDLDRVTTNILNEFVSSS